MDKKKYFLLVQQIKWNIYPKDHNIEKNWSLKFWWQGKPYKFIKKLNTFSTVKERLQYIEVTLKPAAIQKLLNEGVTLQETQPIPHYQEIYNSLQSRQLLYKKDTLREYRSKAKQFCEWNNQQLHRVTPATVRDYMIHLREAKKLKNATINDHISCLRQTFRYLIEDKIVVFNPFKDAARLKKHSVGFDYFTAKQSAKILEAINSPVLLLACYIQFYCFVRPKEMRYLLVGDIDTDKAKMLIRGEDAKNQRTHIIPIPQPLNEVLKDLKLGQYKHNQPLFFALKNTDKIGVNYFSSQHQAIISQLGFNTARYKFYSWKHTGAVAFIKAGGTMKELQLRMRHKHIKTTDGYLMRLGISEFDVNEITLPNITQKSVLLPSHSPKLQDFLKFADREKIKIALQMGALNIEDAELKFLLQSLAKYL